MYITDDFNSYVRKVTISTGIITTIAGSSIQGYSGDGGVATSARLYGPTGIVVDSAGNVYVADKNNNRVRKVTTSTGIISTIVGTGSTSLSVGDGGDATSATLNYPYGVALDSSGTYFTLPSHRATYLLYSCSRRQLVHR